MERIIDSNRSLIITKYAWSVSIDFRETYNRLRFLLMIIVVVVVVVVIVFTIPLKIYWIQIEEKREFIFGALDVHSRDASKMDFHEKLLFFTKKKTRVFYS